MFSGDVLSFLLNHCKVNKYNLNGGQTVNARIFQIVTAGMLFLGTSFALAAPKAVPVNSQYEFPPTPEGQKLIHEFVIKNQGDIELNILSVIPSCSCVSHSFDRAIPPGGEGVIKIGLKTDGYGGKQLHRSILVKTNDPNNKKIYLTVTGKVTSLVTIKPAMVSLSGTPGQNLEALVTISPAKNFNMKILAMTQKFNTPIKAELVAPEQSNRDWHIKITTYSDKADDLYDIITLQTDNPIKPELKVRVYAIYLDENKDLNS